MQADNLFYVSSVFAHNLKILQDLFSAEHVFTENLEMRLIANPSSASLHKILFMTSDDN